MFNMINHFGAGFFFGGFFAGLVVVVVLVGPVQSKIKLLTAWWCLFLGFLVLVVIVLSSFKLPNHIVNNHIEINHNHNHKCIYHTHTERERVRFLQFSLGSNLSVWRWWWTMDSKWKEKNPEPKAEKIGTNFLRKLLF